MPLRVRALTPKDTAKAIGIGIGTALLLSAIMVPAFLTGLSPFPEPLGLAFAETILDQPLPLPVGLLFHVGYVTFWTLAYVALFRDSLTLLRALWLGLTLWVIVLVVFFPVVGWGFLGLGISPKLIIAALVPHLLFAVFLWGLCRASFGPRPQAMALR